jgi:single-stranded DNA-binding protein
MNNQPVQTITGRLGKSPVLYNRDTKKGRFPVAKFSLACETFSNGKVGTVWFQCSAWEKRADTVMRNLRKGDPVQLHGFASTETFTGKDGQEHSYPHMNVIYITFLKPKNNVQAAQNESQTPNADEVGVLF